MKTNSFHFKLPVGVHRKEDLPSQDGVAELLDSLLSRPRVPLSAAVYLVAERQFGNTEDDALEAAAQEIIGAVQSEKISTKGRSPNEAFSIAIPAECFEVFSSFMPSERDLLKLSSPPKDGKGEPVLFFDHCLAADYLGEDDESERISHGPSTDRFENFNGVIFYDLTIARDDLLRIWPQHDERRVRVTTSELLPNQNDPYADFKTGAPGRPSPMQLIEREATRRRAEGETSKELTKEAEALAAWCKAHYPNVSTPSPKTIENRIRRAHRAWKNPHN